MKAVGRLHAILTVTMVTLFTLTSPAAAGSPPSSFRKGLRGGQGYVEGTAEGNDARSALDELSAGSSMVRQLSSDAGQFEELVDLHNAVRCMHNADDLIYDSDIATVAQAYAEELATSSKCGTLVHSNDLFYGENLYYCGSTGTSSCYSAQGAMTGWYDEEVTSGAVTTYDGHATQILWKSTEKLGCGLSVCEKGGYTYNVLVCNYDPPGNWAGQYEDEVEEPSKSSSACGYT